MEVAIALFVGVAVVGAFAYFLRRRAKESKYGISPGEGGGGTRINRK